MTAAEDHDQHGDRKGADTRWVEVCYLCARDWVDWMRGAASEWPRHPVTGERLPVVLAIKQPKGRPPRSITLVYEDSYWPPGTQERTTT